MERTDYGWALNTDTGHVFPANHLTIFEGNIVHYSPTDEERVTGQKKDRYVPYLPFTNDPPDSGTHVAAIETVFIPQEEPPIPPAGVTFVAPPPPKRMGRPKKKG